MDAEGWKRKARRREKKRPRGGWIIPRASCRPKTLRRYCAEENNLRERQLVELV